MMPMTPQPRHIRVEVTMSDGTVKAHEVEMQINPQGVTWKQETRDVGVELGVIREVTDHTITWTEPIRTVNLWSHE